MKQPLASALAAQEVSGLDYDSRRIAPGYLFFAFSGTRADGHAFAASAMERGAIAVVSQEAPGESGAFNEFADRWIQVEHGRHALALASRNFYSKPDERIGAHRHHRNQRQNHDRLLIDSILRAAGHLRR